MHQISGSTHRVVTSRTDALRQRNPSYAVQSLRTAACLRPPLEQYSRYISMERHQNAFVQPARNRRRRAERLASLRSVLRPHFARPLCPRRGKSMSDAAFSLVSYSFSCFNFDWSLFTSVTFRRGGDSTQPVPTAMSRRLLSCCERNRLQLMMQ